MSESNLFDLAGCANLFESSSDFLCVFLGDAFLDSLGGVVDDFLGFLEAEAGLLADDLDDLDLLGANVLQHDVEFGFFFFQQQRRAQRRRRRQQGRRRTRRTSLPWP